MDQQASHERKNQNHEAREAYIDRRMQGHTLFFRKIYHTLYTINDFLLGLWFFIGSICFYFEGSWRILGVTLFVLASFQFLIRPTIRLVHEFHARRHYGNEYDRQGYAERKEGGE